MIQVNDTLLLVHFFSVAGYSAAHFLVNVPHEARTTAAPPGEQSAVGLESVLGHLRVVADANLLDGRGRTPLMCAIVDGQTAAARQLVCFCCSFGILAT